MRARAEGRGHRAWGRGQRRSMLYALCSMLLFGALSAFADVPEVDVKADKQTVRIGDQVVVNVSASPKKGEEIIFPETFEDAGDFEYITSNLMENKPFKKKLAGKSYVLGIYTTGVHVIPPMQLKYKSDATSDWKTFLTKQIPITVESVLTGSEKDIKDIKSFRKYKIGKKILLVLVLLLVFFIVLGTYIFLRSETGQQMLAGNKEVKKPHEIAFGALSELKRKEFPDKGLVKEYYTELSDIVRNYLEGRFSYKAPEMTTEEFLSMLREVNELDVEGKALLKEFLTNCDMVKFAKYGPKKIEMLDAFKLAYGIVDRTRETEEPVIGALSAKL